MAFREKLASTLLATTLAGFAVYLYVIFAIARRGGWAIPVHAIVPALIGMGVLTAILSAIGATIVAVRASADADAPADERDRLVARTASARAYGVVVIGLAGTVGAMLLGVGAFPVASLLVGILVVGEATRYASEAWLYRRGV